MIHRLAEKVKEGTKFFLGHGQSNAHDGRESVGEVLTSFVKEIGGKLANVVIGFFPDRGKVRDMDVCSMEADVYAPGEVVGDVNEVSGIALGSSDRESPAFPGALRLGTIQCFESEKPGEGDREMEGKITFEDVKRAVREMNIHPWQLYTADDMKNDRTFGKLYEDNSRLAAENERLAKENKEVTSKSTEALRKSEVADATKRLDTLMAEGYTDKQRTFIKRQFSPDTQKDLTDEGLKKFVEEGKKSFAETARLFGQESEAGGNGKGGDGKGAGTGQPAGEGERDMEQEALAIITGAKKA